MSTHAGNRFFARAALVRHAICGGSRGKQRVGRWCDAVGQYRRVEHDIAARTIDLRLRPLDNQCAHVDAWPPRRCHPLPGRVIDHVTRHRNVQHQMPAQRAAGKLRHQAETPLLLAVDGTLVGLISLRDEVRPEAPDVLKKLRANGIRRVVMLTGDHPDIATVVAGELGIDEWRAEVMPEDKLAVVRDLQDEGYVVGMVGDGINDAPALAAADIGIAMGLAGTDVAVETADVALANDDLHRLLDVRDLGARAVDVIRENYGISIAVNAVGLLVGAGGALSPVLAAILHNASSVAVVANSSRLIRYRLD